MEMGHYVANQIASPTYSAFGREDVELSVVIPCFNEAERLENLLREWAQALETETPSFEIIVINDGSTDGSGRILDRLRKEMKFLRVIHQLNAGHDRAVRRGYELARGRYVLQVDANGCYEPTDFARMWPLRLSHPLVIAHRTHRLERFPWPLFALILRKLIQWFFGVTLQDPNVPFRLFLKEAALPHLARLPGHLDSVNLWLAVLMMRENPTTVTEVAVPYRRRPGAPSHLRLGSLAGTSMHLFSELVSLRLALMTRPSLLPSPLPQPL
jgi:glycosyltransferase involved in cell wall biosynthesis